MTDDSSEGSRLRGLRRHPAVQAGAVYLGASWALIEGADIFFPSFGLSPNALGWLGLALAIGFVVVVGSVWRAAARGAGAKGEAPAPADGELEARSPLRRRVGRWSV